MLRAHQQQEEGRHANGRAALPMVWVVGCDRIVEEPGCSHAVMHDETRAQRCTQQQCLAMNGTTTPTTTQHKRWEATRGSTQHLTWQLLHGTKMDANMMQLLAKRRRLSERMHLLSQERWRSQVGLGAP